jgi:uncharacterized protein
MNRIFFGTTLVLLLGATAAWADDRAVAVAQAKAVLDALLKDDLDTASRNFTEEAKQALPPDKFKDVWKGIRAEAGPFKKQVATNVEERGRAFIVTLTCEFEKVPFDVVVTVEGRAVLGLFFHPNLRLMHKWPAYVKAEEFRELDVTANPGEWELPGTLTLPKGNGPFPAVILLHDSGPQDRDQSFGPNLPFRDLAGGLATKGVAVLRFDKRTKVHGFKIVKQNIHLTIKEDVLDDALAAAALLRSRKDIDAKKIFVLGEGLGAYLAPLIAQRDEKLAGLILLAGNSRPVPEVLIDQLQQQFSQLDNATDQQKIQMEDFKKQVARLSDPKLEETSLPTEQILGAPVSYWLSLRNYDAPATAAKLKTPLLILQGERDTQVTLTDFEGWKKALKSRDHVSFKSYPDLNHLFMEGQGKSNPQEFRRAGHVSGEVIDDIAEWIKKRSR